MKYRLFYQLKMENRNYQKKNYSNINNINIEKNDSLEKNKNEFQNDNNI